MSSRILTTTTALTKGDPVYITGTNRVGKADANLPATRSVMGIAAGNVGILGDAIIVSDDSTARNVLVGATPGEPWYLASGGGLTNVKPATLNIVLVGFALNSTDLFVKVTGLPDDPKPVVTGITPNTGSPAGGTAITDLAGTGFLPGATATIGGVDIGAVFVSSTKLTGVTGIHAAGVVNVIVTNPDTQTSGTSGNGLFTYVVPIFNPGTLSLDGFWDISRGVYTPGLWPRQPSLGLSGNAGRDMATATTAPDVGAAIDGFDPPLINGATQGLKAGALKTSDFVGLAAGSVSVLGVKDSGGSKIMLGSAADWWDVAITNIDLGVAFFPAPTNRPAVALPGNVGPWVMQAYWGSGDGNLWVRTASPGVVGAWTSMAAGAIAIDDLFLLGGFGSTGFRFASVETSKSVLTLPNFNSILSFYQLTYPSLGL